MSVDPRLEDLLRELAPGVLAALARRYPDFGACEDAVQEALLAAATHWPVDGMPSNPKGWLITAASRRRIEIWRSESARQRREDAVAAAAPVDSPRGREQDDSLTLFFLCCHPSLTPASQVALTLRAVGGLTSVEIARAMLVPEATVRQRISRAKARIRDSGARFTAPAADELPQRVHAVLHVLYLVFNEGYTATSGASLHRVQLGTEAIRLTRQLRARLPAGVDSGEVAGLLALMLLTDARRPARTTAAGALVPLADQDRGVWDRSMIDEGCALLTATLPSSTIGPYQLQAAIAAVHAEAPSTAQTDWPQILGLYDVLARTAPGPMVALNRIVALAMVRGPRAGLLALDAAAPALGAHHRVAAVRAHLLELAGDGDAARIEYERAAATALNLAERRYLEMRAAR